jgi:hypothetical protein
MPIRSALAILLSLFVSAAGATRPQAYPTTPAPAQLAPAVPGPAPKIVPLTSAEGCKMAGDAPEGWTPGADVRNQCCAGTVLREQKTACGKVYGGFAGICLACGDRTCDSNLENACNCPEDCSKSP